MRFVVLGPAGNRRVSLFQEALSRRGHALATIVDWRDWLNNAIDLREQLRPGDILRLESPELDAEVERALLVLGAPESAQEPAYDSISAAALRTMELAEGTMRWSRQWYLGWRLALARVREQLNTAPQHRLMNSPDGIALCYDKARSHAVFHAAGVPSAPLLGIPTGSAHLREAMRAQRMPCVILKFTHGSAAAGIAAIHWPLKGERIAAMSTAAFAADGTLYHSLRVRNYRGTTEVLRLIDALCRQRCVAEAWLPKLEHEGRGLDLRVLVIAGHAAHVVGRCSGSPFTNLHLGNSRVDEKTLQSLVPPATWKRAIEAAERAANCLPDTLYCGVDVLVHRNTVDVAVLEVNAFGDLLPGLQWHDMSTYEAEIAALESAPAAMLRHERLTC